MPEMNINAIDENDILRDIWNIKEVESKTELTPEQIQTINKLKTLSAIFDNELLGYHIKSFMVLQKSKNRQSMKEFVEVVKKKFSDDFNNTGMFKKMMG